LSFLPPEFAVPERVFTDSFVLRPITVADADKDWEAVSEAREHLWELFGEGWGWPAETLTYEKSRDELAWHEDEFRERTSFDYAVVAPDESRLLGCVYVDPSEKPGYDAEVAYWAREPELEEELGAFVRDWIDRAWPFARVAYPGRDVAWAEWVS
jgi:hypothetical protein